MPRKSEKSKGKARSGANRARSESAEPTDPKVTGPSGQAVGEKFARAFAPPELYDAKKRTEWRLEEEPGGRGPYIVELNLQHIEGLQGAAAALETLLEGVAKGEIKWMQISKTYVRCHLSLKEWQLLLQKDSDRADELASKRGGRPMHHRAIYKLWPDFPVQSQIYRSIPTIKANAARSSFQAEGEGIVWAVIDSGIDGGHSHFQTHESLTAPEIVGLHRSFVTTKEELGPEVFLDVLPLDPGESGLDEAERTRRLTLHREQALTDAFGHGTHVAGIIAGQARESGGPKICALERVDLPDATGELKRGSAAVGRAPDARKLHGVAPQCRLVSLRVLDEKGEGRSSTVIQALDYIRTKLNDNPKMLRVHGVNLSVGYEFDAEMFACGQSPICSEVNRLVQSGVVVVAAAGNTGYGTVAASTRPAKVGLSNTINDPGNAEQAITVGATHRDSPYTYGVSYFSSKGPTGDGRLKPDLVAPGERITSCGAGGRLESAKRAAGAAAIPGPNEAFSYYLEDSGTSMAAPHVSGAIAAFLSIRREFIGRPVEVKRIFLESASPLGRERYFEGHGLVDLIRAIQSV